MNFFNKSVLPDVAVALIRSFDILLSLLLQLVGFTIELAYFALHKKTIKEYSGPIQTYFQVVHLLSNGIHVGGVPRINLNLLEPAVELD